MTSLLLLALAAAPNVGIAISKRSGVSVPLSLSRAQSLRSALGPPYTQLPIEDLTSCQAKRPCLVEQARARGWSAVIVLETASVLEEALLLMALVSVDDDGREFAKVAHQSAEQTLLETLPVAVAPLKQRLDTLFPPQTSQAPPTKLPPQVLAQSAPPSPPSGKPAARFVPLAVGAVALAVGLALFGASASVAGRLKSEAFADSAAADRLSAEGKLFQLTGAVLSIGGGILTLGGALLALLWPDPEGPSGSVDAVAVGSR